MPTADWSAVEAQSLWLIQQLGEVLLSSLSPDVILSYAASGDIEGLVAWCTRIREIIEEYHTQIRPQYDEFLNNLYNTEG